MKGPNETGAFQVLVTQYVCVATGDGHFKATGVPGNQYRNWFICSFYFLKYVNMLSYPMYKMYRHLIEMLYIVLYYSKSVSCLCFLCLSLILSINENGDHTLSDIEVNKYLHEWTHWPKRILFGTVFERRVIWGLWIYSRPANKIVAFSVQCWVPVAIHMGS